MKKLLLSLACVAAFSIANAENATVTLNVNDAENLAGQENAEIPAEGENYGTAKNIQPLESFEIQGYSFAFSAAVDAKTQPAYYWNMSTSTNTQNTVRLYATNVMAITAPADVNMVKIDFKLSSQKNAVAEADNGTITFSGNTATWIGSGDVTITTTAGNWRITEMTITTGDEIEVPADKSIFRSDFSADLNGFTEELVKPLPEGLTYVWSCDTRYACAKASSFVGGAAHDVEAILVSPEIDLTQYKDVTLGFEHATNHFATVDKAKEETAVLVREVGGEWTAIEGFTYPESLGWDFLDATAVSIKNFEGKKIQLGFKYISTVAKAGTAEIKNVVVNGTKTAGIDNIELDENAPVEYFNLQGVRVDNPANGLYIRRQGSNVSKVLVK